MKDFKLQASTVSYVNQELNKLIANDNTKAYRLVVSEWKEKRGLSANNQQHLWYSEISKHRGDMTALDVKNECKHLIGLPLLLNSAKHGDKMEFLLCKLDYYKHSYENQLKLIQCLEVTSLFNTAESKEYMNNMIHYYNDHGIPIKFKD